MFIKNFSDLADVDTYTCGLVVSKYLISRGFSLMAKDNKNNKYIFKNSVSLQIALMDAPIWIKVLT
jgi:hypothetical protein